MKKFSWIIVSVLFFANLSHAENIDLFVLAGQSNAQGYAGNAQYYPEDPDGLDSSIHFYWVTPRHSSSKGKWTTMRAQGGRFKKGHFGLEVTFARCLKKAGYHPGIFKYSLGSTSIAHDWGQPGDGKMYDQMVTELANAVSLLEQQGARVHIQAFIWIQGESDAETPDMAHAYEARLRTLIDDFRRRIGDEHDFIVLLGVDEQHPWIEKNNEVLRAQQQIAAEDKMIVFTSMRGLPKADLTHLRPAGLEEHGKRICLAFEELSNGHPGVPGN